MIILWYIAHGFCFSGVPTSSQSSHLCCLCWNPEHSKDGGLGDAKQCNISVWTLVQVAKVFQLGLIGRIKLNF
jgi:hypothetical protein